MKHNLKITAVLLTMFLVAQFIGLAVVNADIFHIEEEVNGTVQQVSNPNVAWVAPPKVEKESDFFNIFLSLIIAFIIAISLLFFLNRFKFSLLLRIWFFVVVCLALFLAFYSLEKLAGFEINSPLPISIAAVIAVSLAFFKIFKRNLLVHNFTELLIYPGIAAIFVPILNFYTLIALLVIISVYDMWAVWKSGLMQKMAKSQLDNLKIIGGFMVPYISKKTGQKIKKWKKTLKRSELKKKKIKMDIAILGGGDVVFPIIAAGVMFKTFGLYSAILVIIGATLGLAYLFARSEKKKFYPAMPFISTGIFIAIGISYLIRFWP